MGPIGYCCFQEACRPSINQALLAVQYNPEIYATQDCIRADRIHHHVPPRSQILIPQSRPQHDWWAGLSSGPHREQGPAVRLTLLDRLLATVGHEKCCFNIMLSCKCMQNVVLFLLMCIVCCIVSLGNKCVITPTCHTGNYCWDRHFLELFSLW